MDRLFSPPVLCSSTAFDEAWGSSSPSQLGRMEGIAFSLAFHIMIIIQGNKDIMRAQRIYERNASR